MPERAGINFYKDTKNESEGIMQRHTKNGGERIVVTIYDTYCSLEGSYGLKDWIKGNFRGVNWCPSTKEWLINRTEFEKIIRDNQDFFRAYARDNYGDRTARLGETPKSVKGSDDPLRVE